MDHLPLQVGKIDHIEIHDADPPDSRRRQIHAQRRTQPARADHEHLGALQLELAFHADFRHDQVPAVTEDFLFRKRGRLRRRFHHRRSARDARDDRDGVAFLHGSGFLFQITDVFVIDIHVDETAQLAFVAVKLAAQILVFGREFAENLADGGAAQFDGVMFVGVLPQRSWNEYLGHGLFPSK